MSQVAAAKVFEIPELAILVIGQLERTYLVACAQVHRAWHEVIIPFLYHSVTLDEQLSLRPSDEVCWDGFQRYSSYMRVLEVDSRAVRDISHFGFNCTNLTDLRLKLSGDTSKNALWAWSLLKLISNNPNISTLHLTSHGGSRLNELDRHLMVLGLLRYMSGLKKLVIAGISMGQSSVDEIMRCAHRLEELDVSLDRIDEDPIPRPSRPRIGFDLDSYLADLSLKDLDDGVDTQDASYILDSAGRRCRRGASLKKLRLVSQDRRQRGVATVDASVLVGLCCSAESIHLSFMGITQDSGMEILHGQVNHPAWCLKHLHIGPLRGVSHSVLVKILAATTTPLVSLYLWEIVLTDELLSVVLQNHGKTLQQVTVSKSHCDVSFRKAGIVALLSQCPHLKSLDVLNCENDGNISMTKTKARQSQWIGPDGRLFKVFTPDQGLLTAFRCSPSFQKTEADGMVLDDAWRHLDVMTRGGKDHVRFITN